MENAWLAGEPPVEIAIRKSPRARNYSLRVSGLDGRVTLTIPKRGNVSEAMAFVRSREAWLRKTLEQQPETVDVREGSELLYRGRFYTVTPAKVRSPQVVDDTLLVPMNKGRTGLRIEAFLKAAARHELHSASERYAKLIGKPLGRISLRDTRSRWGSCTSTGNLMYSWRLIMAPPEVLDYVAAHEVAHMIEMNHSPAFWAVVEKLYPDYQNPRAWLKREGMALHRYRFGN